MLHLLGRFMKTAILPRILPTRYGAKIGTIFTLNKERKNTRPELFADDAKISQCLPQKQNAPPVSGRGVFKSHLVKSAI
jgi:hypothetical protein